MLKSPARLRLILSVAALAAAVFLYLWIGTAQLASPGLQYDEAADAVPAIEMLIGQPLTSISSITFLGREWPLMMLHHIGPSSIYLSFLGLSAFGISVEALRLTQLIIGASTLILLWLAAKSWFDDAVAALAVLLCATAPAFVWWSRAGLNWTLPLLPLALGLLMALHRWWRTRRAACLIAAAFLFGAGVTTKILFIWLAAPIALTALALLGARGLWAAPSRHPSGGLAGRGGRAGHRPSAAHPAQLAVRRHLPVHPRKRSSDAHLRPQQPGCAEQPGARHGRVSADDGRRHAALPGAGRLAAGRGGVDRRRTVRRRAQPRRSAVNPGLIRQWDGRPERRA